jgi:hypothetical protein
VIHHIGYDERRGLAAAGRPYLSPLNQLRDIVAAVRVPVQAVGEFSIEQAIRTPEYGASELLWLCLALRLPSMRIPSRPPAATSKISFAWFAIGSTPIGNSKRA